MTNKNTATLIWQNLFIIFSILISSQLYATQSMLQSMTAQQLIASGKQAFLNRCSGCHGENADGQGPAAVMLDPKPRNLVAGSFKFRSTGQGVLPSVDDLLKVIDQGILGTAMPSFRDVSSQEKVALVAYIRSLRPEFNETSQDQVSIALPPPPKEIFTKKAGLLSAAAKGKVIFQQACLTCHGETGKGDGPSAEGMTDSENQPIRPANLTARFIKGGKTARDIYRTITVGLDGSPMPAFGEMFNEEKRWQLTAYVFYLRGKEENIYNEKDVLK